MPYCPKCGAKISEDDDFCRKCGIKIRSQIKSQSSFNGIDYGNKVRKSKDSSFGKVIILIFVFLLFYYIGSGSLGQVFNSVLPPKVIILSTDANSGFQGLNFVVTIDVQILCESGSGNIEVWASIEQDTATYKKFEVLHVTSGNKYYLTFIYPEATFWSLSGRYRVWIES